MVKTFRPIFFCALLVYAMIIFSGCTTAKNAGMGIAGTCVGIGKGVVQDSKDTWAALKDSDKWLRKNAW